MRKTKNLKSEKAFARASKYIPGGVNSPVRAFKSVGGHPFFVKKGKGSKIWDLDGKSYIDYVCSWGPLILGHSSAVVIKALQDKIKQGLSFGVPTEVETELAQLIKKCIPSMELLRFVNSGTEATMSATRLARGFTKKDKIVKFEGCYHGHADSFLIKAGSGVAAQGLPASAGVTKGVAQDTINLPYNDTDTFSKVIQENHNQIAGVILEPVAANMGVVPAKEGFLEKVRELTQKYNIVLIFDEVITGFRIRSGGAQEFYGIKPDLTCLGKIIGGGLTVGAYGGRKEIMEMVAPLGPVYQAGTLSGNPAAMTSGYHTIKTLMKPGTYLKLEKLGKMLEAGIRSNLEKLGLNFQYNRIGSLSTLFFTGEEVFDFASAQKSDTRKYAKYFHEMLNRGVFLPPSQFEAWFISLAHTEEDIEKTIKANYQSLKNL